MNTVTCTVTKVLSEPKILYGKWFLKVEFESYGHTGETEIILPDNKTAMAVNVGYKFES